MSLQIQITQLASKVGRLEEAARTAFLGAVHRGDPCPFCVARTDNVWPYCVHFEMCILYGVMASELTEEIDEKQNAPPSVCTDQTSENDPNGIGMPPNISGGAISKAEPSTAVKTEREPGVVQQPATESDPGLRRIGAPSSSAGVTESLSGLSGAPEDGADDPRPSEAVPGCWLGGHEFDRVCERGVKGCSQRHPECNHEELRKEANGDVTCVACGAYRGAYDLVQRTAEATTSWVHQLEEPWRVVTPDGPGTITTRGDASSWVRLDSGGSHIYWHVTLKPEQRANARREALLNETIIEQFKPLSKAWLEDWVEIEEWSPQARVQVINALAGEFATRYAEGATDGPRAETALPDMPAWATEDANEETPLPEDAAIKAAFPTRSGRHDLYQTAMRLVGARRSKGGLVSLVNWLLFLIEHGGPTPTRTGSTP